MLFCLILLGFYAVFSSRGAHLAQALGYPVAYYWFGTGLILFCSALLLRNHSDAWYRADRRLLQTGALKRMGRLGGSRAFPAILVSLGVALILVGLAWRWHRLSGWQAPPSWEADMFPTIQRGIATFFAGKNPYARSYWFPSPGPGIPPWQTHMVYLPGLWLPFALAQILGLSDMWVSFSSTVLVLGIFVLAATDAWNRCRVAEGRDQGGRWGSRAALFSCYALLLGGLFFLKNFSAIMHTSPLWFYLSLFCYFAITGRPNAASALLGVCCASRASAIVLVPAWFLYLLRSDRKRLVSGVLFLAVPFAALVGPFLLWNAREFVFSTISWYGISSARVWELRPEWVTESFGLTSVLLRLGMGSWRLAVQVAGQLCVYLLAWRRVRTIQDCLHFMAWALLLFYMTVPVPYGYIYLECVLLLSFAVLADLRRVLEVDSAPGVVIPILPQRQ